VEFRFPDPSCNAYIAFAAMLMAVLDGIQNKIHPGEPFDQNCYDHAQDSAIPTTPRSLAEALDALAEDHEFLLRGDVFTKDVISHWIEHKRRVEVDALRLRPHPYEFCMYYDV
jgi:glutamine synthetase